MFFIIKDETRRDSVINAVRMLNISNPVSVEIKEYKKNRSTSQNRMYWKWVNVLADYQGYASEEMHEVLKQSLLGTIQRKIMGNEYLIAKSTSKLTTVEFSSYLERIEELAGKLQISLPKPDDYMLAMHGR